ncbi:MAG: hypothetical protein QXD77_02485 [Candidatus Aenigmatarchaeota archaeon]
MTGLSMAGPALAAGVTNVADIGSLAGASDSTAVMPTFVVGADAQPADVAAAINLAAYLAGNVYKTESVAVTGGAVGADGVTLRMELGYDTRKTKDFDLTGPLVVSPKTRSSRSASFLQENSLSVGGTTYKYYETISIDNAGVASSVELGLGDTTTGGAFETSLKDQGLKIASQNLKYRLKFDTDLPIGQNITGKTLYFLGKPYTITGTPSTTELKLSPAAGSTFIPYGQSAEISGYTVKVISVGTQTTEAAGLQITKGDASTTVSLAAGESATITLGGVTTTVSVNKIVTGSAGGAEVLIGSSAIVLTSGNEIKDSGGNVLYPNWIVNLGLNAGSTAYNHINLTYVSAHSGFTSDTPALVTGKSISAPENFFIVKNMGPESRSGYKITYSVVSGQNLDGNTATNEYGVKIEAKDSTGSSVKVFNTGSEMASIVAFDWNNDAWRYQNTTGGWSTFTSGTPYIELANGKLNFTVSRSASNGGYIQMAEPTLTESGVAKSWRLEFYNSTTQSSFADVTNDGTTQYGYLSYNNYSIALGKTDGTELKTMSSFTDYYGTTLVSASQSGVSLNVPMDQVYWDIVFGREGDAATTGSGVSKTPIQITFDVAKLDTEISDASKLTTDTVIMGGPAVNKLAAQLLGKTYPAKGAESGIPENAALVKVFQNAFGSGKVAVLVAGWEAEHTDLAVAAIQAGKVTLAQPAAKISGSVAAPTVEAA